MHFPKPGQLARVLSLAALLGAVPLASPAQETSLAGLADRYRRGGREPALEEIDAWTNEWTQREVLNLLRRRPFDPEIAFAAALLHVHRALLDSSSRRPEEHHLAAAARLVPAGADAPGCGRCADVAPRMFLLVALALEESLDVATAHEVARDGLRRFEEDPELLTVLGTTLEAGPGLRRYEPPPGSRLRSSDLQRGLVLPGYSIEGGGSRGEWRPLPSGGLAGAEAAFRRALAADPALGEARLRLGHVRLLRGHAKEAVAELQRVAAEDGSLRRRYLACLLEARAHETRGDVEEAARAYRAAVAVEPEGQSAWIGLGRALDLLARREEAEDAFAAALGSRRKRGDPWWSYSRGDFDRLKTLLAELQAALAP